MLIPVWTLPLHISSSLGVARPFTNKVEKGWKKCTDPIVGRARSITLYDTCTPSSHKLSSCGLNPLPDISKFINLKIGETAPPPYWKCLARSLKILQGLCRNYCVRIL